MNTWEDYLDYLNGIFMNYHATASGVDPDDFNIEFDGDFAPSVVDMNYEVGSGEGVKEIYFLPVIEFPMLDVSSLSFADDAHAYLSDWTKNVGKVVETLFSTPYVEEF